MAEVLAPRLHLLDGAAFLLPKLSQCLAKRVWIEDREPGVLERLLEYLPDRAGVRPPLAIESIGPELSIGPNDDATCWKQRIVKPEQQLGSQERHPLRHHGADVIADGKEVRRKGLRELGAHLARILFEEVAVEIDMLELHRSDGAVPGAGQDRER